MSQPKNLTTSVQLNPSQPLEQHLLWIQMPSILIWSSLAQDLVDIHQHFEQLTLD
jgi:hypothetical protein